MIMLSEAKVDEDRLVVVEENVGRFDVVVRASVGMQKVDGRNELREIAGCDFFRQLDRDESIVLRHSDECVSRRDDERVESDDVGVSLDSRNRANSLELGPERLDTRCRRGILCSMYQLNRDLSHPSR